MLYWFEHFGVAVAAISGVLAAEDKKVDLFGVIVLALVTALGGGTIRDLALGANPVFWIRDANYVLTGACTAVGTFFISRYWRMPQRLLVIADAFALALFTILGAAKALAFQASPVNIVVLGVITGVAGGIMRDVLVGQIPLVFQPAICIYATAAFGGAVLYAVLRQVEVAPHLSLVLSTAAILVLRLAGIELKLALPVYEPKDDPGENPS